jgi:signal transduction histidine kinase/DNA-binding response OmpR family regulator
MNEVMPAADEERSAILIVDDLPEKLLVFSTVLEELGQELVLVRSGSDALREVLKREFAVILLDVNMPDIDGFETAALIRRYKRSAHTPIIFITAYADEMQTSRGYELGAVDYILSPVVPQVLCSKVRVFVDLHRMQRRVERQAEQRVALAAAEAARAAAERNTWRSNFLSQVSRVLNASLEADACARELLSLIASELGRPTALLLLDMPGPCERLVACNIGDEGRPQLTQHAVAELPAAAQQALRHVLDSDSGSPVAWPPPGDADADNGLWLAQGQLLPLRHGSHVLGAIHLGGPPEPELLAELAERAAMAFENARLYRNLQGEIVERRHAERQLQDSNRRKDEFLAMLSHELRNPLAPIRNAIEVIRRVAPPEPKLAWATDVTDRQITHLTGLVEELLDVARISQGKITLQLQPVDLLAVLAHAVETHRPFLDSRGHRLQLQLPTAPVWMRGDFARMSQVVANLLNNAIKYTQEGGAVQLSLTVEGGHALISVRDNGIGIEPELLPNVFELFEQGRRALDRSQGGLGVGLTLVQRLVQLHHGTVEARSAGAGHGAEFIVSLPCLMEVPAAEPAAPATPAAGGVCRVLVVDDNHDAAESTAMFLRIEGHSVETAHDGLDALARATAFVPNVVVLDIGLPGVDGYEVARRLRDSPVGAKALLIALTGYGQKADEAQAMHAGFDRHLVKPADPRALSGLIAEWLGTRVRGGAVGAREAAPR